MANPQGCPTCNGTGCKDRVGIHELMTNSEELTEGINKEPPRARPSLATARNSSAPAVLSACAPELAAPRTTPH